MQGFLLQTGGGFVNEIEDKLKTLPEKSGVYIMKNSDGDVIYVGKAKILKNRVKQYFKSHNHSLKVSKMVENIEDFEYIITDNEKEALILENNLIKQYKPKYNILLKDDKTYPFIKITLNEDFPRVFMTRRIIRDGSRYFGPYCSNLGLREVLTIINEVFGIIQCKKTISEDDKNIKPCLYYQLDKCSAPCNKKISKEEYREKINKIIAFLNGKYEIVLQEITKKMKDASNKLDFETAAKWRDSIQSISLIAEKQKVVSSEGSDSDVIGLYSENNVSCIEIFFIRSGKIVGKEHYFMTLNDISKSENILSEFIKQYYEDSSFIPPNILTQIQIEDEDAISSWLSDKSGHSVKFAVPKLGDKYKLMTMISANAKKEHKERELRIMRDVSFKNNALLNLQELTSMERPPMHIEAYDISNISGSYKVGSMVTFVNGKPCREKYRSFKIKYVQGQDDYSSMEEIISRRIERGLSEKKNTLTKLSFYPFPDVIFVDGGIGHVSTISKVLTDYKLDIPVFGIAKDDKHKTSALVSSDGEININPLSEAFMLLTQIQDEMHRRAITHQRKLHQDSLLKSELLKIKGVGDKKAKLLLKNFKSVKKIKEATYEEILNVNGIDKKTADNVYSYFNSLV